MRAAMLRACEASLISAVSMTCIRIARKHWCKQDLHCCLKTRLDAVSARLFLPNVVPSHNHASSREASRQLLGSLTTASPPILAMDASLLAAARAVTSVNPGILPTSSAKIDHAKELFAK